MPLPYKLVNAISASQDMYYKMVFASWLSLFVQCIVNPQAPVHPVSQTPIYLMVNASAQVVMLQIRGHAINCLMDAYKSISIAKFVPDVFLTMY